MLEIGVHDHDCLAPGEFQPGAQGILMTEISRQADDLDACVCHGEPTEHIHRGIAAAIVDEDDLVVGG